MLTALCDLHSNAGESVTGYGTFYLSFETVESRVLVNVAGEVGIQSNASWFEA